VNSSLGRLLTLAFVVGTLTFLLSGCIATGGYYDDGGIGAVYYEPPDVVYGGWGPGYHVAPYRGDHHRSPSEGGHAAERAYRSAPPSHSVPSIPSKPRPGGSHPDGSHHGGSQSH